MASAFAYCGKKRGLEIGVYSLTLAARIQNFAVRILIRPRPWQAGTLVPVRIADIQDDQSPAKNENLLCAFSFFETLLLVRSERTASDSCLYWRRYTHTHAYECFRLVGMYFIRQVHGAGEFSQVWVTLGAYISTGP